MNRFPRANGPWRPQGAPYYLAGQGERLGLPQLSYEHPRVRDNRQLARISGLTAQICQNYFQGPRRGEGREFADWQLNEVRALLEQCEVEIGKTHVIAAAATEMVDEAYAAFGMEPPARNFRVLVGSESPAESVAVVTPPAITDEQVAGLHAEIARLRAENESLAEQLTKPSHPHPNQPTSPAAGRPAKV